MPKIGEVEFLINFDSMNKGFQEALKKAFEDADIEISGADIEDKLNEIRAHLGLLVTPLSGRRDVDLIKAQGYLERLATPEYLETQIKSFMWSPKLMEKIGFEGETGTPEAEAWAREQLQVLFDEMAQLMRTTLSSDKQYLLNYANLRTVFELFEVATEGTLPYIIERVQKGVKSETAVDKAVITILEGIEGTIVGKSQRHWDILLQDVLADQEDTVIENYKDFVNLILDTFPDDEESLKRIFLGGPKALTEAMKDTLIDILKTTTFRAGIRGIPRSITQLMAKETGIEEEELYTKGAGYLKFDIRALFSSLEGVQAAIDLFGKSKTPEQKEEIIETARLAFERGAGYFFLPLESKKYATMRDILDKADKFGEVLDTFMLYLTPSGEPGAASILSILGAPAQTVKGVLAEAKEALDPKLIEMLEDNQRISGLILEKLRSGDIEENVRDKLEAIIGLWTQMFGGND